MHLSKWVVQGQCWGKQQVLQPRLETSLWVWLVGVTTLTTRHSLRHFFTLVDETFFSGLEALRCGRTCTGRRREPQGHSRAAVRADQLLGVIFGKTFQAALCGSEYVYILFHNRQYADGVLLLNPNSIPGVPGSFFQRSSGSLLVGRMNVLLSSACSCWVFEKHRRPRGVHRVGCWACWGWGEPGRAREALAPRQLTLDHAADLEAAGPSREQASEAGQEAPSTLESTEPVLQTGV